ncbi:hypothetical protein AKG34_03665 [Peribacillus butanolivorans]|nr:hypothetical protein AKG34_03665 [Peribacillus butanolivorans]
MPGVEINVRIFKTLKKTVDKLDFHRVCLQSEPDSISNPAFFDEYPNKAGTRKSRLLFTLQ